MRSRGASVRNRFPPRDAHSRVSFVAALVCSSSAYLGTTRRLLAVLLLVMPRHLTVEAAYMSGEDVVIFRQLLSVAAPFIRVGSSPSAVVLLRAALFSDEDRPHVPDDLYLVAGKPLVDESLASELPNPPGSSEPLRVLNGKGFIGGALSCRGNWNSHLISAILLRIVPPSEQRFVWWDPEAKRMRVAHAPLSIATSSDNAKFYPVASSGDGFSIRSRSTKPPLMNSLTCQGLLILALNSVREATHAIDLDGARWEAA